MMLEHLQMGAHLVNFDRLWNCHLVGESTLFQNSDYTTTLGLIGLAYPKK